MMSDDCTKVLTRVCVMFIFFHHLRICMGCGDSSIVKIYGEIHLFMTRQKPCLNIDSLYFEKPRGAVLYNKCLYKKRPLAPFCS